MLKKVTIVVEDLRTEYRISQLINTVEFKIGDRISTANLKDLISHRGDVTVKIIERKRP